jgi:MacB-like periplasmic core domain
MKRTVLFDDFAADLRYAFRALGSAPGFTLAAVATLAIGIGANTAIFSAVDGVLLKPLPFSQPNRIVVLFQNDRKKGADHDDVAPANFADWRERNASFAALAAAEPFALTYDGPEGEEQVYDWNVTQDFFSVLDARPARGRLFQPSDFTPGSARVLVLTYASWQRRFGANEAIVGKQLSIGKTPVTDLRVPPELENGDVRAEDSGHRRGAAAQAGMVARGRPPQAGRHGRPCARGHEPRGGAAQR